MTVAGAAPFAAFETAAWYDLKIHRIHVSQKEDGANSVAVKALTFTLTDRGPPSKSAATVRASIDITEGQQVVVGKAGLGDSGNALILVLSAKVSD